MVTLVAIHVVRAAQLAPTYAQMAAPSLYEFVRRLVSFLRFLVAIFERACLEAVILSNLSILIVTSARAGQISANSTAIFSFLLTELSCTHPHRHCLHALFDTFFARFRGCTVDAAD